MTFLSNVAADLSAYVSSLPPPARPHLELQLDSGHDGVEMDLHQIAEHNYVGVGGEALCSPGTDSC